MLSSNAHYEKLHAADDAQPEEEKVDRLKKSLTRLRILIIISSVTTILLIAQVLCLFLRSGSKSNGSAFDTGYHTEWAPAKSSIELEQVMFTSSLRYNSSSKEFYREIDPSQPQYVGTPSPEIDAAWEDLLSGQYLLLDDEEAKDLEHPIAVEDRWISEVEVMHSLHCLNTLRKALTPEYYSQPNHLRLHLQPMHVDHCIEQLRQSIQCAGDLTPVPIRPAGEDGAMKLVGTPMVHTCRSWDSFRSWYTLRGTTHGTP